MASLKDKVATLREQLGLPEKRAKVTVDEAIGQLGLVDEVAGLTLSDKVDLCLSTLGIAPEEISASGKAAGKAPATPEPVPMGAPVDPAQMPPPVQPAPMPAPARSGPAKQVAGPVSIDVSGDNGRNGENGHHGESVSSWTPTGQYGRNGTNAGQATRGGDAGNIDCTVATFGDNINVAWQLSNTYTGKGRNLWTTDQTSINAANFSTLALKAGGGFGGHGGNGGNGSKGQRGYAGRNATKSSPGTDGGPGGRGGDAGAGTDGQDAGHGGQIVVRVAEADLYLLSAVQGLELRDTTRLVHGASGGLPGAHGVAGKGGQGGPGGWSKKWTTKTNDDPPKTIHHRQPGGRRGPRGQPGIAPHHPLRRGRDAPAGSLSIDVTGQGGVVASGDLARFKQRFLLDVASVTIAEGAGPNVDGVHEYGQLLYAAKVHLVNHGGMPTPSLTRIRVCAKESAWVKPTGQEVYHNMSIPVSGRAEAQGAIGFTLAFPSQATLLSDPRTKIADKKPNDHDFGPLINKDALRPRAIILGHEDGSRGYYGPSTFFQRVLSSNTYSAPFTLRFPVEQQSGIEAISGLAVGETTLVKFGITNISNVELGTRRHLQVRLWIHDEELKADNFMFRTTEFVDNRGVADVASLAYPGRMWTHENWHLAPGETKHLEGRLKLVSGKSYEGAELRAVVYVSDIAQPNEWRVVQRRLLQIKSTPEFKPLLPCEAVLVTSHTTSDALFQAWEQLLKVRLGLRLDVLDITRNGNFAPSTSTLVGDDARIRDYVSQGALVIILDQPFEHPCAQGRPDTAKMALAPWHLRACPETRRGTSSTIEPPSYLVMQRNTLGATNRSSPRDLLNGDLGIGATRWTTDDVPTADMGDGRVALSSTQTRCCGGMTMDKSSTSFLAGAGEYFANKAAQLYERFTGGDGQVREDPNRPFDHRTRWEQSEDPYNKFATMPVDYKYCGLTHCMMQNCSCCLDTCCCCCGCKPNSWAESTCERVAYKVAQRIEAAGLDGTVVIQPMHVDGAISQLPRVVALGSLQIFVQPRRRARLTTATAPMAGWQEQSGDPARTAFEADAVKSAATLYLVARSMPPSLKIRTLSRALKKQAEPPLRGHDPADHGLMMHAVAHALVGCACDELLYLEARPSIMNGLASRQDPKDLAAVVAEHMPTCNALITEATFVSSEPSGPAAPMPPATEGQKPSQSRYPLSAPLVENEMTTPTSATRRATPIMRTSSSLSMHPDNVKEVDLGLLHGSALATEMASELAALGKGKLLTGAGRKVLAFVSREFAKRFGVEANKEQTKAALDRLERARRETKEKTKPKTRDPDHAHLSAWERGDDVAFAAYKLAYGPEGYMRLRESQGLASGGFIPGFTTDCSAQPAVVLVKGRDAQFQLGDPARTGSWKTGLAFAEALEAERKKMGLGGVSDTMREQLRASTDGDDEPESPSRAGIRVPKPVFADGYPSYHLPPFPPTAPGQPIPFLPPAPFDGVIPQAYAMEPEIQEAPPLAETPVAIGIPVSAAEYVDNSVQQEPQTMKGGAEDEPDEASDHEDH